MARGLLIAFDNQGFGRQIPFEAECLFGRLPECQAQILDPQVSKRHARIVGSPAGFEIEDLESLNGVLINGKRVRKRADLKPNDVITVGPQSYLFNPELEVLPLQQEGTEAGAVVMVDDSATAPAPTEIAAPPLDQAFAGLPPEFLSEALPHLLSGGKGLAGLLDVLHRFIAFDSAAVLMPREDRLEPVWISGASRTLMFSRSIAKAALEGGRGVRLDDAALDPVFKAGKSVSQGKLRAVLAAPLQLGNQKHGVVFLSRDRPKGLTHRDLELLLQAAPLLSLACAQAEQIGSLRREVERASRREGPPEILGRSAILEGLRRTLRKVAPTPSPVLITGETGTGKELLAQWLHALGPGPGKPLVAVNCGAVPENLAESELFGHERGAFSGADRAKPGQLELASGGTLFLDEIGELPLALQVKFLRALEQKVTYRLGGVRPIHTDFRLVTATHRDLSAMCREGRFREDLFYRIHVIHIEMPPLRSRPEDIEELLAFFLTRFVRELGRELNGFSNAAAAALRRYPWPGNVRELRNVVERLAVLAEGPEITADDLPAEMTLPGAEDAESAEGSLASRVAILERRMILAAMRGAKGKKSAAARALGISRPTLDKKLSDYRIDLFSEE